MNNIILEASWKGALDTQILKHKPRTLWWLNVGAA